MLSTRLVTAVARSLVRVGCTPAGLVGRVLSSGGVADPACSGTHPDLLAAGMMPHALQAQAADEFALSGCRRNFAVHPFPKLLC
jgi:hypothetical protein